MPGKIFLIGFMGSGKSYWGWKWSNVSGIPFMDMDVIIEGLEGQTVTEVFESKGEDYFREMEAKVVRSFQHFDNAIIACGGGTPCFHDNMQWMNENGTTVYLTATPTEIRDRVLSEEGKRPLFKNVNPAEILFFIEQKLKEREPFYRQAKITLNGSEIDEKTIDLIKGIDNG